MAKDKVHMPQGMGGLVRYFDEYKSKIEFKPGVVIAAILVVILLELFLHWQGASLLGLG
ncbi:preprotein translocase subunit Sec61beta [Nanoarchaeota archaeon]